MMRAYAKGLIPMNTELSDKYYINDLENFSPGNSDFLTDTETREIIFEYQKTKDILIRNKLVKAYSKYVVSIAKNYQNQGLSLSDLISEGMLGLINSIDNFDLTNETQFMTYANVVISRQMREALDQFNFSVKVPKNIRNQQRRVKSGTEELHLLGVDESDIRDSFLDNEIDLECYYNPNQFAKVMDQSAGDDESEPWAENFFVEEASPEDKLIRLDLKRDIARLFKKRLTKAEAKVLRLYFGIDQPYQIISIVDLGKKLGIGGERARQLKESGLKKLRTEECKKILRKYLC